MSNDPIVEETRSLVDGHITLDPKAAASGRYPAINVLDSISRMMNEVVRDDHVMMANKLRRAISRYEEVELLVQIGEYQPGQDPEADFAIRAYPKIMEFLTQPDMKPTSGRKTLMAMKEILAL